MTELPGWDTAFLQRHLPVGIFGAPFEYRVTAGSTNTLAMELAKSGAPAGLVVLAETQTAGRGRREKKWHSPAGTGIWMSLLVPVPDMPHGDRLCNMACAAAVADTLRSAAGVDAGIKWPNDVWIRGRKVCGILIEAVPGRRIFVAGMGINVNTGPGEFPPELRDTATSLRIEAGRPFSREELLLGLLSRFGGLHAQLAGGDAGAVVNAYAGRSFLPGRTVTAGKVSGIAECIRADGALMVRTGEGALAAVLDGEIRFG